MIVISNGKAKGLDLFTDSVLDLCRISKRGWDQLDCSMAKWADSEKGVLGVPRVREIGEQLNRAGGWALMVQASQLVIETLELSDKTLAGVFLTEINSAWHEIGDWRR